MYLIGKKSLNDLYQSTKNWENFEENDVETKKCCLADRRTVINALYIV